MSIYTTVILKIPFSVVYFVVPTFESHYKVFFAENTFRRVSVCLNLSWYFTKETDAIFRICVEISKISFY